MIKKHTLSKKPISLSFKLILGSSVLIIVGAFLLIVFLLASIGGINFSNNAAQSAFKPIDKKLKSMGAKFICDNGDNGHSSADNQIPWYQAYYDVLQTNDLRNKLTTILTSNGYILGPGTSQNYMQAANKDFKVTVTVQHNVEVPLYCKSGKFGRLAQASGSQAVVDINITRPI